MEERSDARVADLSPSPPMLGSPWTDVEACGEGMVSAKLRAASLPSLRKAVCSCSCILTCMHANHRVISMYTTMC